MNPRLAMLSTFGLGIIGAAVGVQGYFDGQIVYCQQTSCRSIPDWMQINQSVTSVQRIPGASGWKLSSAVLGAASFGASMCIARRLASNEPHHLQLKNIWTTNNLLKAQIMASADLEAFNNQAMIEAAEVAYAVVEPYVKHQALLAGDSLDDIISPADKVAGAEVQALSSSQQVKEGLGEASSHGLKLFDWNTFRTQPDDFAHLRIIGKTGKGKTLLADWLLDVLGGERFVITIKRKPRNWRGVKVYGLTRDYEACRLMLEWVLTEMNRRFDLIEKDIDPPMTNFVVDEWRSISQNVKQLKDPETGETVTPSAKEMMKEIITLARDAKLRMIALAQGKQVRTWGLEDESDLEECFTTIRLGEFALEHARLLRNSCKKDSDDYEYWTSVLNELATQGARCCMVENMPALVPALSNWKRAEVESGNWLERTRKQLEEYLKLEGISSDDSEESEREEEDEEDVAEIELTHLSAKAQKLLAYLKRRTQKTGDSWICVRDVQRSEPIKGLKNDDIKALFDEIVSASLGELNDSGDIRLL